MKSYTIISKEAEQKVKKSKKENASDIESRSKGNKVNEITISYHDKSIALKSCHIKSSADAADLLINAWNMDTIELCESFKVVLLNNSNKVKGIYKMASGGITGTIVDVRILFAVALKTLSTAIIISHNHPSGTLKPSQADIQLTNKIKQASQLLDIKLLDHIILIPNGLYYSFSDEGLI